MPEIVEDDARVILIGTRDTLPASIGPDDDGPRFSIAHDDIALSDARALIAAWDRTQGALPELPPGYSVGKWDGGTDWYYRGPDGKIVYHWEENTGFKRWVPDCAANAADATRRAWAHFAATLDPKWAQLLRNAGLSV